MKSPAFQFYPTDWLGSQRVQMLTLEEEGAYIRLIAFCWQHGSIPSDPSQAAKLIGKGASTTLATTVLTMFQPSTVSGRMIHERLEVERQKQTDWRLKSSAGGIKSAAIRARSEKSKGGSRVVQPPLENGSNQNSTLLPSVSPLLSSSPLSEGEKGVAQYAPPSHGVERPSLKEVLFQADKMGLAPWKAEDWFHEMEGGGWLDYNHRPIAMWQSVLTRVKTKWEADGRPMAPPSKARNGHASIMDIKSAIQVKLEKAKALKHRFCSDTAMSEVWSDVTKRKDYSNLMKEIRELNNRIEGMV